MTPGILEARLLYIYSADPLMISTCSERTQLIAARKQEAKKKLQASVTRLMELASKKYS